MRVFSRFARWFGSAWQRFAGARLGTLLALATVGVGGCTGLFFQPQRDLVRTPTDIGLPFEDVQFVARDGVRLHGWFLPASGHAVGTVLFLHGNAENISTHIGSVYWMPARGFNVFLFDYRGYGGSDSVPTLGGVQLDIDAAMHHLLSRQDVDPHRIVLFGQSLGAALACYYAARGPLRRDVRVAVIDSSFTSYRAIAREKLAQLWWTRWLALPAGLLVDDEYSPIDVVADIAPTPVLFVGGGRDEIVPVHHARELFDAARAPKTLWVFDDAGHIQAFREDAARQRLVEFLTEHLQP